MTNVLRAVAVLLIVLAGPAVELRAQEFDVRAHYTKSEHMIPMRDGVKLFTAVYAPKDTSRTYPILLNRTPYSVSPYGPDAYKDSLGPSPLFMKAGYIFVYQDVRGRNMSEGEFVNMRPQLKSKGGPQQIDESTDTYDTIEWLLRNVPNNNGRVGQWGISYPGFYTATGMLSNHPALKAVSPQAPIADWFMGDDFHHNGAFFLPHAFNFFANFGRPRPQPTSQPVERFNHGTPDGYEFFMRLGALPNADKRYFKGNIAFWNELMRHPNYDDFWQARNLLPHLKDVKPAVLVVGGWFDAENLFGALNIYQTVEKNNPSTYNVLVMGPWFHGGWARSDGESLGVARFGSKTSVFYRENIELPFFEFYLKDKGTLNLPEATVFETGSNQWRTYDQWPPRGTVARNLYLGAGGKLSFDAPSEGEGFDEYVSDPMKPVPFINNIAIGMTREYMTDDQRFAARRPDVLVYQTEPLAEDVTVVGPIIAGLIVSTTGSDADFIVKLIDVFPDDAPDAEPNPTGFRWGGYQMMVRGDVMRARFRESFSKPVAMKPGEPTKVSFKLQDVNHTFKRGHRIMVQIQSTWFPLVDHNPQKFVENIYQASDADFQKATHRVYRSRTRPSHLKLTLKPQAGGQN